MFYIQKFSFTLPLYYFFKKVIPLADFILTFLQDSKTELEQLLDLDNTFSCLFHSLVVSYLHYLWISPTSFKVNNTAWT